MKTVGLVAVLAALLTGVPAAPAAAAPITNPASDVQVSYLTFEITGLRSAPKWMYARPDNADYSFRGPSSCSDRRQFGLICTIEISLSNLANAEIRNASATFSRAGTMQQSLSFPTIAPGDIGRVTFVAETDSLGVVNDSLGVSRGDGSNVEWTDTWTGIESPPTVPVGFGSTFTSNQFRLFWNPPVNDGGRPISGYTVELVQQNPDWNPGDADFSDHRYLSEQLACNFTGRPELRVCDVPNNQLDRVEAGVGYQWRLTAQNSVDVDQWFGVGLLPAVFMSDSFDVTSILGAEPDSPIPATTTLTIPSVTTPPPTVTTQTPATNTNTSTTTSVSNGDNPAVGYDPIIQVERYNDAPNILSIVEAYDYDNKLDAPVLRLYQAYFNRRPDLGGAKYWLNIRRQGYGLGQIAGFMSGSAEFNNTYAGTSNAKYVENVYRNVLGRDFDQAGYDYWLGLLNKGDLTRSGTVFYITANPEFTNAYPFKNDHPKLTITSCDARAETVVIRNDGESVVDLIGWKLHDSGPQFTLEDIGELAPNIGPGRSIELRSGLTPATPTMATSVVWSDRNIWNNTGDTAFLVSPADRTHDQLDCN